MNYENQNKPEGKEGSSIEQSTTPDASKELVDFSFRKTVQDFFGDLERVASELGADAKGDIDGEEYYDKMAERYRTYAEDLDQLSYPGRKKEVVQENPYLVGEALGAVAGFMERTSASVDSQSTGDEETQLQHDNAKKVFMDSCAKVFPNINTPSPNQLDRMADRIKAETLKLQSPHLENIRYSVDGLKDLRLSYQGRSRELAAKLDKIILDIERQMGSAVETNQVSTNAQKELADAAGIMYELQLLRDDLQGKIYGRQDVSNAEARQIDNIRNDILEEGDNHENDVESEKIPLDEVERRLADESIKGIKNIESVMTPEVRAAILEYMLNAIDKKINQGKMLAEETPGTAVEARGVSHVLGFGAAGDRKLQFPASVSEGRIVNGEDIARMRIDEYMKKYLGYDLRTDQGRLEDLNTFTNMLD